MDRIQEVEIFYFKTNSYVQCAESSHLSFGKLLLQDRQRSALHGREKDKKLSERGQENRKHEKLKFKIHNQRVQMTRNDGFDRCFQRVLLLKILKFSLIFSTPQFFFHISSTNAECLTQ